MDQKGLDRAVFFASAPRTLSALVQAVQA